jgi:acyl-CoA hydrolase
VSEGAPSPPPERRKPWGIWYEPSEVSDWDLTAKPAAASAVTLTEQMELTDANMLGNVHGGEIMKLVDTCGGLAATKHCGGPVVTVALDEMTFIEPVFVGDVVTVKAMVNDTGRTSLEVGVRVEAETIRTGRRVHTSSAYLVYVALDRDGRPRPVPPVIVEDDEQRQRQREAKVRRQARLTRKQAILAAREEKGEGPSTGPAHPAPMA